MAVTTRQTSLLVAEDWTKVYQTFRNADFQSYDFQTLRKSMIDYLRIYYPEDFNDFIESSEFIALIDLISFLGQSLAFRGDLNARESFIDTAQRRDSVLKLARLISYYPKRNIPASGFLKVISVSSTEQLVDSNGLNLSGLVVNWNDLSNNNWLEQFTTVINASLNANQIIGKPSNSQLINGVINDEYQINLIAGVVPTYGFASTVEGTRTKFEIVSPTSVNSTNIYENDPRPSGTFNLLYKNDNLGNSSNTTGFFLYFKQGELKYIDFNFSESIPNRVFNVSTDNINNTDIWLYSLNNQSQLDTLWEQVPVVNNNNVIFNNLTNKNLYQINSRAGDQIDLIFGDGSFASIPRGDYRLFYRVSNGLNYKITPAELNNIVIPINYTSRSGRTETINIRASLQYTVANASSRETVEEIRQKAPQQYYTQNRMVNGEDYNILPYTLFNNIVKVKAVNRTSSGISRYLDVIDTTGKYSSTNIFAADGYLYQELFTKSFNFDFSLSNDITRVIYNQITPIINSSETLQFFYSEYPKISCTNILWNTSTNISLGVTGYFYNSVGTVVEVGTSAGVGDNNSFIRQGCIIKFYAGDNKHFNFKNNIVAGPIASTGDQYYIYVSVTNVVGDGANSGKGNLSNGFGPITLSQYVPTGASISYIFPMFSSKLSTQNISDITEYCKSYKDFALRYDFAKYAWLIIEQADIGTGDFSLSNTGSTLGQLADNSWLLYFTKSTTGYNVAYRGLNYIFESVADTSFYFDESTKIFDPKSGFTIKDQITVLKINSLPDSSNPLSVDYTWQVYKNIVEVDGYKNPNKILVTYADLNHDSLPDNPELFKNIVEPTVNVNNKFVYFQNIVGYNNFISTVPIDNNTIDSTFNTFKEIQSNQTLYSTGQIFYVKTDNKFYQLTVTGLAEGLNVAQYQLSELTTYTAFVGRQSLYFQYKHNSPSHQRIDPSPNNIIDLYILTKQYATDYTAWIQDTSNTVVEPIIPITGELELEFNNLENYKSISDTIIYNSAKFKPLFGAKAEANLQAIFKVVKNLNISISDNEVKSSIIAAINSYFDVNNWEFGETFYFSELSAYLHSVLAPNIASITIVPSDETSPFGSLLQINAEYNEIITSAATVDNIQVISAITAAQINQTVLA